MIKPKKVIEPENTMVSFRCTKQMRKDILHLVARGFYVNISDFVRQAISTYLKVEHLGIETNVRENKDFMD